jgi:hypothetical protein
MESERGRPQKSETQQSDETATSHNYE